MGNVEHQETAPNVQWSSRRYEATLNDSEMHLGSTSTVPLLYPKLPAFTVYGWKFVEKVGYVRSEDIPVYVRISGSVIGRRQDRIFGEFEIVFLVHEACPCIIDQQATMKKWHSYKCFRSGTVLKTTRFAYLRGGLL